MLGLQLLPLVVTAGSQRRRANSYIRRDGVKNIHENVINFIAN